MIDKLIGRSTLDGFCRKKRKEVQVLLADQKTVSKQLSLDLQKAQRATLSVRDL